MMFIFEESRALYPSIYLYGSSSLMTSSQQQRYVHAKITEAYWIHHQLGKSLPVFLFTKIEYNPYVTDPKGIEFYSQDSVCNTLNFPASSGVNGMIVWSTSSNMGKRCGVIAEYLTDVYGPKVKTVQDEFQR